MRCLGHHLSADSSIALGFRNTSNNVWAGYWRNAHEGLRQASFQAQAKFFNTSLRSVAGFRWSRWPWQRSYADRLDRLQRRLIACIRPVRPHPGENATHYFRRRNLTCNRVAERFGKWSQLWAQDVLKCRGNDPGSWALPLRTWHGRSWLQARRFENSQGGQWNRLCTRALRGHPAKRWHEGCADARRAAT